jgi:hypothetical protein
MARGGPVKRGHCVSVRVTPEELAAWRARQEGSGRRELGAWVRAVVNETAGLARPDGRQVGDVPVVPEVNHDAYRVLVGAANNLNQLTRRFHAEGAAPAGLAAAVAAVREAARAVLGRDVQMGRRPAA